MKKNSFKQLLFLAVYYGIARHLLASYNPGGRFAKKLRAFCGKMIFRHCGKNVNIERGAMFGSGRNISLGDNSGLGINCNVPSNIQIGNNVMMAPNVYILARNHAYNRIDIPMNQQGYKSDTSVQTIIEDDCWIGMNVIMTPGRHIQKGSIVGAGCLLCKNFPPYSIIGGNPSKLIRSRLNQHT